MEESDDPFVKMIETIAVLENENRALCLISVYLGQRGDSNTIAGITTVYNHLVGEKNTPRKVRGLLTRLVSAGLIGRETERLIGTSKVSFHQITNLGIVGLVYVLFFLVENPLELTWNEEIFKDVVNWSEESFIQFLLDTFIEKLTTPSKILISVKKGRDIKKIKVKPISITIPKILSGKGTFKAFEDILWDYFHLNVGLTKDQLTEKLGGDPAGKHLRKLALFLSSNKIGKTKYYQLSTRGIFLLPVIVLLIREISVDKSVLESLQIFKVESNENPWIILTKQSINFFKKLYSLDEKL